MGRKNLLQACPRFKNSYHLKIIHADWDLRNRCYNSFTLVTNCYILLVSRGPSRDRTLRGRCGQKKPLQIHTDCRGKALDSAGEVCYAAWGRSRVGSCPASSPPSIMFQPRGAGMVRGSKSAGTVSSSGNGVSGSSYLSTPVRV